MALSMLQQRAAGVLLVRPALGALHAQQRDAVGRQMDLQLLGPGLLQHLPEAAQVVHQLCAQPGDLRVLQTMESYQVMDAAQQAAGVRVFAEAERGNTRPQPQRLLRPVQVVQGVVQGAILLAMPGLVVLLPGTDAQIEKTQRQQQHAQGQRKASVTCVIWCGHGCCHLDSLAEAAPLTIAVWPALSQPQARLFRGCC